MRNLRFFKIHILAVLFSFGLMGCGNNQPPRIVSCSSTMTEIIYEVGAGKQVVGATSFCFFPDQVMADKEAGRITVIGDFININFERIDSLRPDIIFTDTNMQRKIAEKLRSMGYTVYHFEPDRLEEVYECILKTGEAAGKKKNAEKIIRKMKEGFDKIRNVSQYLEPVKVYMEINHMGPWTFGSISPLQDMIETAGGVNVFGDTAVGVFMTSNTEVVRRNPDIILSPIWLDAELGGWKGITPLMEIYTRPGYVETNAVTHSRVLYYDSALMKHFGPRQIVAVQKLAYLLHPEHFTSPEGTIPWELGWIK